MRGAAVRRAAVRRAARASSGTAMAGTTCTGGGFGSMFALSLIFLLIILFSEAEIEGEQVFYNCKNIKPRNIINV